MNNRINGYLEKWHSTKGDKPCNDDDFINNFTELVESSDISGWRFGGENNYCGFTALLLLVDAFGCQIGYGFEFAYSFNANNKESFIRIFDSNNFGYYVQEYISLPGSDDRCINLLNIIKAKLLNWGGY